MASIDPLVTLRSRSPPAYETAVASSSLNAGTSLIDRSPLAVIPLLSDNPDTCSRCIRKLTDDQKTLCGRCRSEVYCSDACRDLAWDEYHSGLCQHLPSISYGIQAQKITSADAHAGFLLLRLVFIHFERNTTHRNHLADYKDLSIEEIRSADPNGLDPRIRTFFELLPRPLSKGEKSVLDLVSSKVDLPKVELEFLLSRFSGNNHIISDERLRPIGHAILPELSRACNHSCSPTAILCTYWDKSSGGLKTSIRTLRPLKQDEELTIPYLDPILPFHERQMFLQERYAFTCTCPLCTVQTLIATPTSHPTMQPRPEDLNRLFQIVIGKGIATALSNLKTLVTQPGFDVYQLGGLPLPSRISQEKLPIGLINCLKPNVVQQLVELFGEATSEGNWQAACMAGMHVLAIYVPVYGWRHPLVGLHLLELAKVVFNTHVTMSGSDAGGRATEMLLQSTVYSRWANYSLACSGPQGGALCGEGEDGGPRSEIEVLERAIVGEWRYVVHS